MTTASSDATALARVRQECGSLAPAPSDPELAAINLAILFEDALGLTLTDEQIGALVGADAGAVEALLRTSSGDA